MATKLIQAVMIENTIIQLKHSDNEVSVDAGRAWFLVIGTSVVYPKKKDSVTDEKSARAWANLVLMKQGLIKSK